ncbi:BQ2448_6088 [Microbotryum intermedium]|uniref:BQ2448_6088 protein n=1 Tax=Microbotryum intermedium TaxID=269621 RepID=A0A238FR26_9BASI|nr:BQ2448_6088 [Microbotryum intermedium]
MEVCSHTPPQELYLLSEFPEAAQLIDVFLLIDNDMSKPTNVNISGIEAFAAGVRHCTSLRTLGLGLKPPYPTDKRPYPTATMDSLTVVLGAIPSTTPLSDLYLKIILATPSSIEHSTRTLTRAITDNHMPHFESVHISLLVYKDEPCDPPLAKDQPDSEVEDGLLGAQLWAGLRRFCDDHSIDLRLEGNFKMRLHR